ncbi:MAG: 4Fe-4S binding protein [bacterium]
MEVYRKLQKVLDLHAMGAPESEDLLEILRELLEPGEAALALSMRFELEEATEIARRAGVTPSLAVKRLESMADKGAILCTNRDGKARYALLPPMPGFFEFSLMKGEHTPAADRMGRLWNRYYTRELGRQMHASGISLCRVLPVEKQIPPTAEVMDFERCTWLIGTARSLALGRCQCRFSSGNCDAPLDVCILLDTWAEFLTDRGLARRVGVEEARDALLRAEEACLVHTVNNATRSPFICNCCPCCCFMLRGITQFHLPDTLAASRLVARLDRERCIGCGLCADRCRFGALELEGTVMRFEERRCYGCGLCVSACAERALSLIERKDYAQPFPDGRSLNRAVAAAKKKVK